MEQTIGIGQKQTQVTEQPHIALNIGLWALKLGLMGMFIMAGSGKLTGAEQMVGLFEALGLGQWFRYFTGATEVIAAVLLLIPATAGIGALMVIGTMIGAIATHVFVVGGSFAMPAGLLGAALIVLYANRNQVLSLVQKILGK